MIDNSKVEIQEESLSYFLSDPAPQYTSYISGGLFTVPDYQNRASLLTKGF